MGAVTVEKNIRKTKPSYRSPIRMLHNLVPRLKVIVMNSNPESGRKYLKAGADAFVSKGDQPECLFETLHRMTTQLNRELNQS